MCSPLGFDQLKHVINSNTLQYLLGSIGVDRGLSTGVGAILRVAARAALVGAAQHGCPHIAHQIRRQEEISLEQNAARTVRGPDGAGCER